MEALVIMVMMLFAIFICAFLFAAIRRLSIWNRTYDRLAKRYAGRKGRSTGVVYGFGITKPSLTFDYGRTFCSLRNRKSFRFSSGPQTEISMIWPNRKLKLDVATSPTKSRSWGPGATQQVFIDEPQFQSDYYCTSNDPVLAEKMLNSGVQWQIEQLRRHLGSNEVIVNISRGNLTVSKPGYIKEYVGLEDFVRFSLELFDQLMLIEAEGIEFVNANEASVVDEVKCPICSEEIMQNMVVCSRCKTPHCQDCWHYNGQCATFACRETRCIHAGSIAD